MFDEEDIETRLEGVPQQLCVAFAARCALRVLPLLAVEGKNKVPFWYWSTKNRSNHLLAILEAQHLGIKLSTTIEIDAAEAFDAADSFNAADNFSPASSAASALAAHTGRVYYDLLTEALESNTDDEVFFLELINTHPNLMAMLAISNDIDPAVNTALNAACAALEAASLEANIAKIVEKATLSDLELITGKSKPGLLSRFLKPQKQDNPIPLLEFFQQPLWPSRQIPKVLAPQWHLFCAWVKALDDGFEFWLDWYRDRLAGKALDPAFLKKQMNIPAEIEEQGPKAVNAYLQTLETATAKKEVLKQLNLVRAIFIGNGESGKTSLIRALHGEPVVEGKEKMTPGIAIRSWPVGETEITARFWDFGGQVMSHATHQFFLRERCLYVLVLSGRSEFNANDEAEYWLAHVKAFGKDAPVMLIGNKFDCAPVNLDMRALREKHPNIVGFYSLSCTEARGRFKNRFETFRTDLIEALQKVGTHQIYFTKQQFAVLEAVRDRSLKNAFLSQDEFKEICAAQNVGEAGAQNREWLLDLLDKLGEVVHFPQMTTLDSFVLNPRWLTYGVYTLLYSDEVTQNKGELSEAEVIKILRSKTLEDEDGNTLSYPPQNVLLF